MSTEQVPLRSAKTTFEIVEGLRELGGAGVSELANHLSMPTSSVHDYLKTLEAEEYIVREDGTYLIGARFLTLGEHYRAGQKVWKVARPEIDDLAQETGEHANLLVEEHGWGIFLYRLQGEDAVELDTHAGMRVHLQTTALGKSILAHRPRSAVDAILDRHGLPAVTERTIVDRERLFEELDEIRERGYATDDEERITGMRCVAAPILTDGRPIAAVSVSAPKSRLQGEQFRTDLPNAVMDTANVIQINLTYG